MAKPIPHLSPADIAHVLEIAWADPDPLTRLLFSHGLSEGQVIQLLRRELSSSAFKLWSARLKQPGGKPVSRAGSRASVFSRPVSKAGK